MRPNSQSGSSSRFHFEMHSFLHSTLFSPGLPIVLPHIFCFGRHLFLKIQTTHDHNNNKKYKYKKLKI